MCPAIAKDDCPDMQVCHLKSQATVLTFVVFAEGHQWRGNSKAGSQRCGGSQQPAQHVRDPEGQVQAASRTAGALPPPFAWSYRSPLLAGCILKHLCAVEAMSSKSAVRQVRPHRGLCRRQCRFLKPAEE